MAQETKWCIASCKKNEIALALIIDGIPQDLLWLAVQEDAQEWFDKYWQWQTTRCPFLPKEIQCHPVTVPTS
jgi:hypothetical protein